MGRPSNSKNSCRTKIPVRFQHSFPVALQTGELSPHSSIQHQSVLQKIPCSFSPFFDIPLIYLTLVLSFLLFAFPSCDLPFVPLARALPCSHQLFYPKLHLFHHALHSGQRNICASGFVPFFLVLVPTSGCTIVGVVVHLHQYAYIQT